MPHLRQVHDAGLCDGFTGLRDQVAGEGVQHAFQGFVDQPLRSCSGIVRLHGRVIALEERNMGADMRQIEDSGREAVIEIGR